MTDGVGGERLLGLEIEFAADREEVARAIGAANGTQVQSRRLAVGGYKEIKLTGGWTAGFDPSLKEDGVAPARCVEINPPPFPLSDFDDAVAPVLMAVDAVPHEFTARSGMHVHVDAAGLQARDLLRLCRLVDARGKDLVIRPERRRFLRPLPPGLLWLPDDAVSDAVLREEWYAGYREAPEPGTGRLHPARRRLMNLGSYWYRGTVEFRWFAATLDPAAVRAALVESLEMVAAAAVAADR